MPPIPRPYPRFIADSPQEGKPYGDWAERLAGEFARACEPLVAEAGTPVDHETVNWFPERGYGGRVYVPATGRGGDVEYFGWVSFERSEEGAPSALRASADFTDVTAD